MDQIWLKLHVYLAELCAADEITADQHDFWEDKISGTAEALARDSVAIRVRRAYNDGRIEEWVEHYAPKTWDEWGQHHCVFCEEDEE